MVEQVQRGALSTGSRRALDETIAAAALRLERAVSLARVVLFAALLARFLWSAVLPLAGLLITAVPLGLGILFSLAVLVLTRRPPRGHRLWTASVALDSLAVTTSLLPNALWPTAEYVGILNLPDTTGLLIATFGAGLRLSPRAAALGCGLNFTALLILVEVDRVVSGARFATGTGMVSIMSIIVLASGALAVILAASTRRLVESGAAAALRADRAEQGLGTVLADHHDLGSLLSSALISADLLVKALGRPSSGGGEALRQALELSTDLRQVRDLMNEVKARALGDLSAFSERSAVALLEVADQVARQASSRFGAVRFDLTGLPLDTLVLVAGGAPTLHRVLLNLVVNACEGNGEGPEAARQVSLAARRDTSRGVVDVTVEDDGPGLPSPILAATGRECGKPGGLGIGLSVVRGLVEASGGSVRLENRDEGGGFVTVTLLDGAAEPAR